MLTTSRRIHPPDNDDRRRIRVEILQGLVVCKSPLVPRANQHALTHIQIFTVVCVLLWIVVAAGTIRGAISGKMFYAPCLGTDLHAKKLKDEEQVTKD